MSLAGPVIAVVGPTASGKSSLAEQLAVCLSSAVISVDAMQIYRGMNIGTAKTPADKRRAHLLMVDVADISQSYSAELFQKQARSYINAFLKQRRVPVLCGGTGLYLDAAIDELRFPSGKAGDSARKRYEQLAEKYGPDKLYALLVKRDPQSAQLIHPHNARRVIRALEMHDQGLSYAEGNKRLHEHTPHYDCRIWGISMNRMRLYDRIERRVDKMFDVGFVEEVKRLRSQGLESSQTARQAIGYKEVLNYLEGRCTLEDAKLAVKRNTKHYAKRQLTWLRRDGRIQWLDYNRVDEKQAVQLILANLKESSN